MAILRVLKGANPGQVLPLHPGKNVLGRASSCDIVLNSDAVSRQHAVVEFTGGQWIIYDENSQNGTFVNGKRLPGGPRGKAALETYDRVDIVNYRFAFEDYQAPSSDIGLGEETIASPDVASAIAIPQEGTGSSTNLATKLATLLRIIEQTASALDLKSALPKILESLMTSFVNAHSGYLLLRDERGELTTVAECHIGPAPDKPRISRVVIDEAIRTRSALLTGDALTDENLSKSESVKQFSLRSLICSPLLAPDGNPVGVIQLNARDSKKAFNEQDLDVLAGVARHVALVIENSRLHDQMLREQRIEYERRFRRVIEGSIQGVLIHRDHQPLFVNAAYAAIHGYTVSEVLALPSVVSLIAEDERERLVGYAIARFEGEPAPTRYEYRGLRKNGTTVWLENLVTVVDWDGGTAIQSTVVDITDRRRAEEELRTHRDQLELRVRERTAELSDANRQLREEIDRRAHTERELRDSEALYQSLVDHLPMNVFRKDRDGRLVFVNRLYCDTMGRSANELLGKTVFDLYSRDLALQYDTDDRQVMATGDVLSRTERHRDPQGTIRFIDITKSVVRDHRGAVIGTQGVFRDVTARIKAEEALRESEERFRQLAEHINQVFWVADLATRRVLYVSPAYAELWGQPTGRLLINADDFLTPVHPEDRPHVTPLSVFPGHAQRLDLDYRLVHPDGTTRWISDRRFAVRGSDGSVYRVAGIAEDVTERRRAEDALRRAARLASIGTLAAGIAHEINNPVAAVLTSSETALAVFGQPGQEALLRHCLKTIVEAAHRCGRIVTNVLKFARQEPTDKELQNLNDVVLRGLRHAVSMVESSGITVHALLSTEPIEIVLNSIEIEQVVTNLLQNAVQASPRGSAIAVATVKESDHACLIVEDHGKGMTREDLEHMFDPFFTTRQKSGGTGLGLSIVHGIVDAHGGSIDVESQPGHGTKITVRLPLPHTDQSPEIGRERRPA